MKPGKGETLFILDQQREIKAIEAGMKAAGLEDTAFADRVFDAGHEQDYGAPASQWTDLPGPPWKRAIEPEMAVTPEEVGNVRASLEATIAHGGLRKTILGRKRTAKKILEQIEQRA